MQTIREVQIKLADGYISRAIKPNTQSVVELIHKKGSARLIIAKVLSITFNTKKKKWQTGAH